MDISYITNNIDEYKQMLTDRFMDNSIIDEIIKIHNEYTKKLVIWEKSKQLKNNISKTINKSNDSEQLDKIEFDISNCSESLDLNPIELVKQDLSCYSKKSLINLVKL